MKDIITENLVCLDLDAKDKYEAISILANAIYQEERLQDLQKYINSVIEREEMTSTGIGFKIAIPHGKCENVKDTSIAIGRVKEGIEWGSLDGEKVHLIILLAIPHSNSGDAHLRMLASISRKLIHEEFRTTLFKSVNPKEISTVLNDIL